MPRAIRRRRRPNRKEETAKERNPFWELGIFSGWPATPELRSYWQTWGAVMLQEWRNQHKNYRGMLRDRADRRLETILATFGTPPTEKE